MTETPSLADPTALITGFMTSSSEFP